MDNKCVTYHILSLNYVSDFQTSLFVESFDRNPNQN